MKLDDILDEIRRRVMNVLVAVDQLCWVLLTLGNGHPDETISAALWRMEGQGKWAGRLLRPVVDLLLRPFGKDHCKWAAIAEQYGRQQHRFYRNEGNSCK